MGKSMFKIIVSVLVLLLGTQFVIAGEWVEYDLNSNNWNRFGIGNEGVGIAEATSNSLVFFNARTGVWLEHELATPMSVVTILADGFLVLVVGENRAFAFNTINSSVHELIYVGSLLSTGSSESQSYDCGPELALVVTDQEFCVFDAELNQWQRHAYCLTESPNYMQRHDCHDFYAVSYLPLYNGDKVNVVYSLLQHEFNETAKGMHTNSIPADYGFAGISNNSTASYFIGYSAVTNTFSRIDVPLGATTGGSYPNSFADSIGLKTAYVCYHYEYSAGESQNFHNYGYDTRHGVWQYHLVTVPSSIHFGDWKAGGTFSSNWIHHIDDDSEDLLVFDGTSNSFFLQEQAFNPISSLLGGNVMMRADPENVLAMAMESQDESFNNSPYSGNFLPGMNNLSYLSDGPGQDMKTLNCYNGNNNTWHSHTTGDITSAGRSSQQVQLHISTEPQPEAIFYSAYRDEIYATDLDGWPTTTPMITDHYAGVYQSSYGIAKIFDAHRGALYSLNGFTSITGGQRYFMTLDNSTHEAKAYSLATGIWSYQTLESDGVIQWGPDLIGIAKSSNGYVYDVYYAYDASDDNWSVLHPDGAYVALTVSERTALYLTNHFAYALGMGDVTAVPTNTLTLQGGQGTVEIIWEGGLNLDSNEVRLTVKGPEITSRKSWEIPVLREGLCHFRAIDNNPHLGLGGLFTYTLEVSAGRNEWLTISTEKIILQPVQVASIRQIYPNPFNPCTTIDFNLTRSQNVTLCIYNIAGQKVRALVSELLEAGTHYVQWKGCDDEGRFMASGLYYVSLETDAAIHRKKVMLLR